MNVQFGEKKPVKQLEEEIIVNGRVVGTVRETAADGCKYFVSIGIPGTLAGLLLGHGRQKEEAIIDAFKSGRKNASTTLKYIEDLEAALSV